MFHHDFHTTDKRLDFSSRLYSQSPENPKIFFTEQREQLPGDYLVTALPELSEIWVSTFGHLLWEGESAARLIGCHQIGLLRPPGGWVYLAGIQHPAWTAPSLVVAPASNLGENYYELWPVDAYRFNSLTLLISLDAMIYIAYACVYLKPADNWVWEFSQTQ